MTTAKGRKNIEDESYIVRFAPRLEEFAASALPSLKDSELGGDPVFHLETAAAFEDYTEDIRSSKFCGESVGEKYMHDELEKSSFILCMYVYDRRLRERLAGFMAVRILSTGTLYVEFICTNAAHYRGIGSILMGYLDKVKAALGLRKIMLNSVPEAVPFYEKLGFTKKKKNFNFSQMNIPENVDPKYYITHRMTKKNKNAGSGSGSRGRRQRGRSQSKGRRSS